MKTTIELSESLLIEAKRVAEERGTTLREIVESALRSALQDRSRQKAPFRLERRTFKGKGLQAGIREGDWEVIRSIAYEGRGG